VVKLVIIGGSLTRTEKVPSLSPGQGTLSIKWVPKQSFKIWSGKLKSAKLLQE